MKTFGASKEFLLDKNQEWEIVGEGVKRKIMGYDDKIMLVKVEFDEGGIGYKHEHHHSQVTYVESGSFDFSIGDVTKTVKAGALGTPHYWPSTSIIVAITSEFVSYEQFDGRLPHRF